MRARGEERRRICWRTDRTVAIADTIAAFQDPQQSSLLNLYPLSGSDHHLEDSKKQTYLLGFHASSGSGETCKYRRWPGIQQSNLRTPPFHEDRPSDMITSGKALLLTKLQDETKEKKPISNYLKHLQQVIWASRPILISGKQTAVGLPLRGSH